MTEWMQMLSRVRACDKKVKIALVGKYVQLHDAYLSVAESLRHAGYENKAEIQIKWVLSEQLTKETADEYLSDCDGILVPGGFGQRGIEGKIVAAQYRCV